MERPQTTAAARKQPRGAIRELLLDAASSLMRELDTVEIGILDIAARAEVNHGMIRYYFGSKEGMLLALLDRDVGVRIKQLGALFRLDLTATERMRIHLEGVLDTYYQIPYLNRLIQLMVRDATAERVHHIAEELLRPIADAQHRIIRDGIASGEFREVDPKLFYFNTIGSADGLYANRFTLSAVFGGNTAPNNALHERYKRQTVETLMAGLLI